MDKKRTSAAACLLLATVAAVCLGGPGARADSPPPSVEEVDAEGVRQALWTYFADRYSEAACSALYADLTCDGTEELLVVQLLPDRAGGSILLHDGDLDPERFNGGMVTVLSAGTAGVETLYEYACGPDYRGCICLTVREGRPCLVECGDEGTVYRFLTEERGRDCGGEEKLLLSYDGQALTCLDELFTTWD